MNTSNNDLREFLLEHLDRLKHWFFKHIKVVLPVILVICILITVGIVAGARHKKAEREAAAAAAQEQETETVDLSNTLIVPEVPLQVNDNDSLNQLFDTYYSAMADGDIETISSMNNFLGETEEIKLGENSKYIESYDNLEVYYKPGPAEGTYIVYVYSDAKFYDYDAEVPGLLAYYVCTADDGTLYLNEGEESEAVINYIREVSLQDDCVDLNNKVAVKYKDMLANDPDLTTFLVDVTTQIDTSVGEVLAQVENPTEPGEDAAEEGAEEGAEPTVATVVTKVKATDVVRIRKSDSTTADELGRAQIGDEFTLIEEQGNGWSKISYNGSEAFIKSEFLEPAETEVSVITPETNEEDGGAETAEAPAKADDSNTKVSGTVTANDTVRIRASASENGEKIATVYPGTKLDLIQKQSDGWTKIKYNGKIAYVKSEYVD